MACLVKLACCDAEATHEEQDHTQDREDTRGPHGPCRTQSTEAQRGGRAGDGRMRGSWVGGPAHRVQGFTNLALVSRWLSSMRKGRKEGPCSAQSHLRALHDFRTRLQNPAKCTGSYATWPSPGPASCLLTSMFSCPGKSASWDVSPHAILSFLTRMFSLFSFPRPTSTHLSKTQFEVSSSASPSLASFYKNH